MPYSCEVDEQTFGCDRPFSFSPGPGARVSGHDDSPGDHPSANAADSSAASPVSSAAPSPSPAAAGSHAAAGNVGYLLWCSSKAQKACTSVDSTRTYLTVILHSKGQLISMQEHKYSVVTAELRKNI